MKRSPTATCNPSALKRRSISSMMSLKDSDRPLSTND
jgi:hypothetical protein